MDKFDRLGAEGVRLLLGVGRKDESGDFTKGAELSREQASPLIRLLEFGKTYDLIQRDEYDEADTNFPNPFTTPPTEWKMQSYSNAQRMIDKATEIQIVNPHNVKYRYSFGFDVLGELTYLFTMNETLAAGIRELAEIEAIFQSAGYSDSMDDHIDKKDGEIRVMIDPSVVRGLEYYTGPVFEAELTFEVTGEDGRPIRFGSVGGGGRYDGLVGRFRGEDVPATGFSIGVSRLFSALKAVGSPIVAGAAHRGPVVVLVLDKSEIARYQGLITTLRQAGIAAELYLGQSGMNAQLKYADKRKAVCAVIQGSNERDHADGPQVVVRDLVLGLELAKATKDRADYVELRAKAQSAVAEADLVAKVREVLARHPG